MNELDRLKTNYLDHVKQWNKLGVRTKKYNELLKGVYKLKTLEAMKFFANEVLYAVKVWEK